MMHTKRDLDSIPEYKALEKVLGYDRVPSVKHTTGLGIVEEVEL